MSTSPASGARKRWLLWLPLLALSAWLAWVQPGVHPQDEAAVVQPTTRPHAPERTTDRSESAATWAAQPLRFSSHGQRQPIREKNYSAEFNMGKCIYPIEIP